MKKLYVLLNKGFTQTLGITLILLAQNAQVSAQSCPSSGWQTLSSYPNTYYPGTKNTVSAGTKTITLGAVTYGSTPISAGDVLLIIQMQGAQISSNNDNTYGDGSGSGSGYYNNAGLYAGTMEYAVAKTAVPLTGGTLTLVNGTVNAYKNAVAGTYGQYTYQVIRVPTYYDVQLTSNITAPAWDGTDGGVIVLWATDKIDLNNKTIDASGMGFRGGGGRAFSGQSGSYYSTDYVTLSSATTNGSKGEGIAGTPKYINNQNYTSLLTNAAEGYPNGSYAQGAPGNAGGGGTDGDPAGNDYNTGGGGGGNGGVGGVGGNAWYSSATTGGRAAASFGQASASRFVMGGGGGAGTTNNATGTPGSGLASSGAAGGGIIILHAGTYITGTGTILANGAAGNSTVQNDGAGGGGAGGSILIYSANNVTSNITVHADGGVGGSDETGGGASHGPGGGGGGGVVYSNASLATGSSANGAVAGTTAGMTYSFGASGGFPGSITTNASLSSMPAFPVSCDVLGVNFVSLTANTSNGSVNLQWTVAHEINTINYLVEKSTDGTNYSVVGTVAYKAGDAEANVYQYTDETASSTGGKIYYRIRETDADGSFIYSHVVSVDAGDATATPLSVYPNPAQSSVTVSFTASAPGAISLRLFDMKGAPLWIQQYEAQQGVNTIQIDYIRNLPDGLYILQWFDKMRSQQVKVVVKH